MASEPPKGTGSLPVAATGAVHTPHAQAVPPPFPHSSQLLSHFGDGCGPGIDLQECWGRYRGHSEQAGMPLLHAVVPQHDEFELSANLASREVAFHQVSSAVTYSCGSTGVNQ